MTRAEFAKFLRYALFPLYVLGCAIVWCLEGYDDHADSPMVALVASILVGAVVFVFVGYPLETASTGAGWLLTAIPAALAPLTFATLNGGALHLRQNRREKAKRAEFERAERVRLIRRMEAELDLEEMDLT